MSEVLTKIVTDCETNTTVEIPMTAEEIADYYATGERTAQLRAETEAAAEALAALKASAKAKLVAGQPLTEEEAATIVL